MKVTLLKYPTDEDWALARRCALITMGKTPTKEPDMAWKRAILRARHSPIRVLNYAFLIEGIPSNTATHLARHVHAVPFISSLRNDRQDRMDGDAARRDTPVDMILYCNAEELMTIANKRLCHKAAERTQEAVRMMCREAFGKTPEIASELVPMCVHCGNTCHEMYPCDEPPWSEGWLRA